MIKDFIAKNYKDGEPIFIQDIPCSSRNYLRQELKMLADEGFVSRLYKGVYYKNYQTIFKTPGRVSIDKYIDKMYLDGDNGFYTGLTLANKYGFTTQMPSIIEIVSNAATTKQRRSNVDGFNIVVYKPVVKIRKDNASSLQFLDLMTNIDKYSELRGEELKKKIMEYIEAVNVNFDMVKKYISKYPANVYKNIYEEGLMNELV